MPHALRNMAVTLMDRKGVAVMPARALTAGSFQGSNNATADEYLRFVPDPRTYTTVQGTGVGDLRVEGEIASR